MISLEVASTIKSEYPDIEVTVVDENEILPLEVYYGLEITNALIK